MNAAIAPSAATAPRRMSLWTAFWSLAGGAIVGGIAASLYAATLREALRLDDPGGRHSAVWTPFAPIDDWARAADLASLAVVVLTCALCVRRISRTETLELPLPAASAGLAGVGLVGYATHSWWSLLAILPVAFVARYAARPPAVLSRRGVVVAGVCAVAYLAVVGAAFADLQSHPLAASPNMSCAGPTGLGILQPLNPRTGDGGPLQYPHRPGGIAVACLEVRNNAWSRAATVLGVAQGALPGRASWALELTAISFRGARVRFAPGRRISIPAGRQREILVAVRMLGCVGGAGSADLRSIPLRVQVGRSTTTQWIALTRPIATRCPAG
jgi:hypothetical protein